MRVVLLLASGLLAAACASPPNAPPPVVAATIEPAETEPEPAAGPGPAKAPRPLEIRNECHEPVIVLYGDVLGPSSPHAVIPGETSANAPRGADVTITVWIVDDKDAGLASVQVSRRMRKVEIGKISRPGA